MWELKVCYASICVHFLVFNIKPLQQEIIGNVSRILGALKKSHESNTTTVNAVKLESFLAETVDVKLPCKHLYDDEDIFLSSSLLRPDCVGDDEYIV